MKCYELLQIIILLFIQIRTCYTATTTTTTNKNNSINNDTRWDDFDYGYGVVTLSLSRSGSNYLCQIISKIINHPRITICYELFNNNPQQQPNDYLLLAQEYLREEREEYPNQFIGFKWKPHQGYIELDDVWQWFKNKNFKVVHNYRNPLDRYISEIKHSLPEFRTHCRDEECLEKQKNLKFKISIRELLNALEQDQSQLTNLTRIMNKYSIDYYNISYEELSYSSDDNRVRVVQNMIDYVIGKGKYKVTLSDLDIGLVASSTPRQDEHVSNFDDIRKALINTEYEQYLRTK